jgi:hypothetical protein
MNISIRDANISIRVANISSRVANISVRNANISIRVANISIRDANKLYSLNSFKCPLSQKSKKKIFYESASKEETALDT